MNEDDLHYFLCNFQIKISSTIQKYFYSISYDDGSCPVSNCHRIIVLKQHIGFVQPFNLKVHIQVLNYVSQQKPWKLDWKLQSRFAEKLYMDILV